MAIYDSTAFETALAAYYENAGYTASGSVEEAQAFATACRQLAGFPREMSQGGKNAEQIVLSSDIYVAQALQAETWISSHQTATSGGRRYFSFEHFRA